ncbi:unnamed protein product [Caenorhabditis auriculariae]|uniref:SET domain-containing protein n=1 Tax=Caenorhabditis auriculariae TaxID=2777116 RepID=A0A8S1H3Z3_9PELO|nr:unnamed protein product [Caenorhabditis auriculariae]
MKGPKRPGLRSGNRKITRRMIATLIGAGPDSEKKQVKKFTKKKVKASTTTATITTNVLEPSEQWTSTSSSGTPSISTRASRSNKNTTPMNEHVLQLLVDARKKMDELDGSSTTSGESSTTMAAQPPVTRKSKRKIRRISARIIETTVGEAPPQIDDMAPPKKISRSSKNSPTDTPKATQDVPNVPKPIVARKDLRVVQHNDQLYLREWDSKTRSRISSDRRLRRHFTLQFGNIRSYIRIRAIQLENCLSRIGSSLTPQKTLESYSFPLQNLFYMSHSHYIAPSVRVLLNPDLTNGKALPIPMYSDIESNSDPGKDLSKVSIPPKFDYITTTNLDYLPSNYLQEIENANVKTVTCNCYATDDGLACWESKTCPCYQLNREFCNLQGGVRGKNARKGHYTCFSSYGPAKIYDTSNDFYSIFGFACGPACKCSGKCANNALAIPADPIFGLEVFRRDARLGFGVRATSSIPMGTAVMEFAGDVVMSEEVNNRDSDDYALRLHNTDDHKQFKDFVEKRLGSFAKKWFSKNWYVDPKARGNVSRYISHGCFPNLGFFRVFQGGLAPHQGHLLLIAMEDIAPGTELQFDYGDNYLTGHSITECLCGTLGCPSQQPFVHLRHFNDEEIRKLLRKRHESALSCYNWVNGIEEPKKEKIPKTNGLPQKS